MRRDIVMIGASAGGIGAIQHLIAEIPADLPASIFVIVHIPAWRRSELPKVLSVNAKLPAKHPEPNEPVRPGRIYVAPPDHHMLVEEGKILLWRGPKENRHRPAINASFRTAATNYRERSIGVILSGALDDGVTGLWWIKRYGGIAIVQDPTETSFPDMPFAAMEHVDVDYVANAGKIGKLIVQLVNGDSTVEDR